MIKLIPSLEMLEDILRTIRIQDVLDILIVAYLVYKLIDLLRETRAGQLIKGVLGIILVYVLSQAFQLRAVSAIIRYLITYGVFALLIIFQPELRKILEKLGRTSFSLTQIRKTVNSIGGNSFENNSNMMRCINAICDSCAILSKERTGAFLGKYGTAITDGINAAHHIAVILKAVSADAVHCLSDLCQRKAGTPQLFQYLSQLRLKNDQ